MYFRYNKALKILNVLLSCFLFHIITFLYSILQHLYQYDISANTKFNLTLKTHLLLHLKEDIKRFGCALHFETEKGEQFNKFIRTHLLYSNCRADNRDFAYKFGKQDILRHIADGGSWIDKSTGTRVQCGTGVLNFLHKNGSEFSDNYFGKLLKEFMDNNHVSKKIAAGVSVAFSLNHDVSRLYVGRVVENNDALCINLYQLFSPDMNLGSAACQPTEDYYTLEDAQILRMLHIITNGYSSIVNICKYGSYQFFNSHYNQFFY